MTIFLVAMRMAVVADISASLFREPQQKPVRDYYSPRPAARPYGAALRAFKIAPGDFSQRTKSEKCDFRFSHKIDELRSLILATPPCIAKEALLLQSFLNCNHAA